MRVTAYVCYSVRASHVCGCAAVCPVCHHASVTLLSHLHPDSFGLPNLRFFNLIKRQEAKYNKQGDPKAAAPSAQRAASAYGSQLPRAAGPSMLPQSSLPVPMHTGHALKSPRSRSQLLPPQPAPGSMPVHSGARKRGLADTSDD